jgi:hypothetical protein
MLRAFNSFLGTRIKPRTYVKPVIDLNPVDQKLPQYLEEWPDDIIADQLAKIYRMEGTALKGLPIKGYRARIEKEFKKRGLEFAYD